MTHWYTDFDDAKRMLLILPIVRAADSIVMHYLGEERKLSEAQRETYRNLLFRIHHTEPCLHAARSTTLRNILQYDSELDALVGCRQKALRLLAHLFPANSTRQGVWK